MPISTLWHVGVLTMKYKKNAEPRLSFIYRSDKLTTGKIKPAQAIISPNWPHAKALLGMNSALEKVIHNWKQMGTMHKKGTSITDLKLQTEVS